MTPRVFQIFRAVVVMAGGAALAFALAGLRHQQLDYRYLLLLIAMATVASRLNISIPHVKGEVTVGDTLVFLTLMFYGGEAAIVMAAVDGLSSSLRVSRKTRVWLFNSTQMALSTFLTVSVLHVLFGNIVEAERGGFSLTFFGAICVMFFVQYITNSGLVATYSALKSQQPILTTWRTSYLWTSISYLAGASIAGLSAQFLQGLSIYTVLMVTPIVAIVYITYKTYLRNIQASLTQTKEAERHAELLEASEERFRSAFNHASIGMALVSEDGKWLQVNHALSQIVGYSNDELLASDIQSLTHPDDLADLLIQQTRLAKGEIPRYQSEKRYIHKSGREVWTLLSVSRVRDAETNGLRFIFQIQDITERKRAEAQLVHDAFHDALTGLPNRALFVDHLRLAVARNLRHRYPVFSVLFLDLDRFKVVNDSLGHLVGDQLLIEVANRIQKSLRPGDTIARFGGDEFTLLLEDLNTESEAITVAERILRELAVPFDIGGHEVFTSGSIGLAPSTIGYKHAEDMLRDADTAMYCAKASGGDCYQTFDKTMHARAVETLETQNDLRQAIARNELLVYYQPIVSLDTFQIEGFEALLRWRHPRHGFISPNRFIPLAEETGLITSIGAWILREACSQLRQWQERYPTTQPLTMSVNVSGKQLADPGFINQVEEAINNNNLAPHSLKLEITESAVVHNVETASEMLKAIRALGATISIDDFGTGYSSLSTLHRFPISTLKIDSSFVRRIGGDDDNTEIIRTIMALAKNLAMDVTAEGVETLDQVTKLRSLGCESGQGYFFSRPVPSADAETLLVEILPTGVTASLENNVQSLMHRLVA